MARIRNVGNLDLVYFSAIDHQTMVGGYLAGVLRDKPSDPAGSHEITLKIDLDTPIDGCPANELFVYGDGRFEWDGWETKILEEPNTKENQYGKLLVRQNLEFFGRIPHELRQALTVIACYSAHGLVGVRWRDSWEDQEKVGSLQIELGGGAFVLREPVRNPVAFIESMANKCSKAGQIKPAYL